MEQPLGGLWEPVVATARFGAMELVWLFIGGVFLAGALFAASAGIEGWGKPPRIIDEDADGEPDEPDGSAAS